VPSASPASGGPIIPRDRRRPATGGRGSSGAVKLAAAALGVIVVLAVGILVITQLGGDDAPTKPNTAGNVAQDGEPTPGANATATATPGLTAAETTVAVLNGTTFSGLAGRISDQVSESGYQKGAVTDNTVQNLQTSVVLYDTGAAAQARRLARRFKIATVRRLDTATRAITGSADVVIIAGADQAP
jgi:hypothetical protein